MPKTYDVIKHPATRQPIVSSLAGASGLNATGQPKINLTPKAAVKNPLARKPH